MKKTLYAMCIAFCLGAMNLYAQVQEGSFPLIVNNFAKETFADSQIYITSIGLAGGSWFWCDSLGIPHPNNAADKNAPGHLVKNGVNYANCSVRLTSAKNMRIPPTVGGGRIYISCPEPMYVQFPDPNNPGDPCNDVYYDWFEYTYGYNTLQFGGNTTQVDIFGIPMTARVYQVAGTGIAKTYDDSCGIHMARDSIMARFNRMSTPFQGCIKPCRVVAPRSSAQFGNGGAYANYMKPYVDSLWDLWSTTQCVFMNGTQRFTIDVNAATGILTFGGAGSGTMTKPSTQEVWSNTGTRFPGYAGAAFSAALCRGVARNGAWWYDSTTYYKKSTYKSEFAEILHDISIGHKAYGFGYDDNNNQSSVLIIGNPKPLTSLTLNIQPFKTLPVPTVVPVQKSTAGRLAVRRLSNNLIALVNAGQIENVSLIGLNGKTVVKNAVVNNNVLSMKNLAGGTYYVKVKDKAGKISIAKIIKR